MIIVGNEVAVFLFEFRSASKDLYIFTVYIAYLMMAVEVTAINFSVGFICREL